MALRGNLNPVTLSTMAVNSYSSCERQNGQNRLEISLKQTFTELSFSYVIISDLHILAYSEKHT